MKRGYIHNKFYIGQRVRVTRSGSEGSVIKVERNLAVPYWAKGMKFPPVEYLVRLDSGTEIWWYETALEVAQ
jgi:hypothetical protein